MSNLSRVGFSAADWVVFAGLLVISACIGIYYGLSGGKQKTTKEFLMGDRNLKIVPVAVSILVSFLSAILILGAPAEMYTKGTQYYLYVFGQMAAVVLATVLFVPLFYPLKLTSMYEYIEMRFKSRAARLTATVINILSSLIYTGIASFAPATALQAMTGFPEWASFLLIGCVCTFYTFMGGLKAVVWVDAFQAFIMFGSLVTIVIKATIGVGGISRVWELNDDWGRINFWNFDFDPTIRHTFWALTLGGMINWVGAFGASQQSIQRFSALPSLREAKIAVLLNCVGLFLMVTTACLVGISVFAFYAMKGCDPYKSGEIKNSNQIIPLFVIQMLNYPGVPGLFIAGLFSGALSSVSSNLSSQVATSWEDIIKPHMKRKSEATKTWITRLLVILFGVLGIGVSFVVRKLGGTVLQISLSFMGAASGALNGFVVLGAFFPCCNWIGAIAGPLVSYAVMMWIGIAKYSVIGVKDTLDFPDQSCLANNSLSLISYNYSVPHINQSVIMTHLSSTMTPAVTQSIPQQSALHQLYSLSYLWYSTLGLIIAVVVGLLVTAVTGPMKGEDVDPRLLIPVCDRLCCCLCWCLPTSLRETLYCGAKYPEDPQDHHQEEIYGINSDSRLVLEEGVEFGKENQTTTIQLTSVKNLKSS